MKAEAAERVKGFHEHVQPKIKLEAANQQGTSQVLLHNILLIVDELREGGTVRGL